MFLHNSRLLCFLLGSASAQTVQWLTRPGQNTVPLTVETNTNASLSETSEYLFLAPFNFGGPWYGPHIYDGSGNLVWFGGDVTQNEAFDLHVSLFKGKNNGTHLVFSDGQGTSETVGSNRFVNQSYDVVASYGSQGSIPGPDLHETNVVANVPGPSNSLIYDSYKEASKNLAAFGGPKHGFIFSGCFQDVDLSTNELVLQWCSGDHVPFNESQVPIGQAGSGTRDSPWDYFHLNAIDKTPEGDYVISARHTSTIYKIAGANSSHPGSIIWRLGGELNDFTMRPSSFNFSFQHHIRYHGTTGSVSTYSLFDNGSNGSEESSDASSAMFFTVNEAKKVATLTKQIVQPQGGSAGAMGSVQLMDNGNVFVGWGEVPYISEHAPDGTLQFYAHVGPSDFDVVCYRSFKYPWVGKPNTVPDVLAYRKTCKQPKSFVYVSWNGATEVASYSVAVSNSSTSGFQRIGAVVPKNGYETALPVNVRGFVKYAQVTAYDASGAVLSKSAPTAYFVPPANSFGCNVQNCGTFFDYSSDNSIASSC